MQVISYDIADVGKVPMLHISAVVTSCVWPVVLGVVGAAVANVHENSVPAGNESALFTGSAFSLNFLFESSRSPSVIR